MIRAKVDNTQTSLLLIPSVPVIVPAQSVLNAKPREVPHPIPYQGSKRSLARYILEHFPQDAGTLIEPFAGSAAVSLAAAHHGIAQHLRISDVNEPLIELWQAIRDTPEDISSRYETLWHDQDGREAAFYISVRERFNNNHAPADFLYLLARCVKAAIRYNSNGEFNQSPDNRRKGAKPCIMRRNITSASRLLQGRSELVSQDYKNTLFSATPVDVVYMDPPYQGTSGKRDARYSQSLAYEHFVETLRELNNRHISYIVSYDGRTGTKMFGNTLPAYLELVHHEIDAGTSSQATLLGRDDRTIESLYLSRPLVERLERQKTSGSKGIP